MARGKKQRLANLGAERLADALLDLVDMATAGEQVPHLSAIHFNAFATVLPSAFRCRAMASMDSSNCFK